MKQSLHASPKYLAWRETLRKNRLVFSGDETLSLIHRKDELLFAFLNVQAKSEDGESLPPCILIRGHAVVILPLIRDKESGKLHVILVQQLRIASGERLFELPAGMLDENVHAPEEVALKEFEEEVGLDLGDTPLHAINKEPLYTSPGLLDEGIFYFYFEKTLPKSEWEKLNNEQRGCEEEGEKITLCVLPFEEAFSKIKSIPALYAMAWHKTQR